MKSAEIQVLIQPTTDISRGHWRLSSLKIRKDGSRFLPVEGTFDPVNLLFLKLIIIYLNHYTSRARTNQNSLPILEVNHKDELEGLYKPLFVT